MKILGVVFTQGVSLKVWVEKGLIDREKQIYEEHLRQGHFDKIIWFTYGMNDDEVRNKLIEEDRLDDRIKVIPMPRYFFNKYLMRTYSYFMPIFQKKYCEKLNIIKTNQMEGAWTAAIIHRKYGVPFLLRTGYTYSALLIQKIAERKWSYKKVKLYWKYIKYRKIEKFLYYCCTHATVSSTHDKKYVQEQYLVSERKIDVITNYIDCNLFRNIEIIGSKSQRFIFVGRLSAEKNLFNIIQALGELKVGLDIYGKGELQEKLAEFAEQHHYDVCFKGTVNNNELPLIYNSYRYYILASPYEGMPKTLLEAMACGCICFGTKVEGIQEVIKDCENGYLIEDTSIESIKKAITMGIRQDGNDRISQNAIDYICKNHSLENVVEKEWEIMKRIGNYE